ncbi:MULTISPECIES: DUF1367 family protein [unclassified Neptuniibacter]|uniref:DUF1367 family protein n=1 Tax=unclassified Neptuniibacter TaxID=2630693 RepID=UPI000C459EF2|nr:MULTISPECIES: DUF1367 family protein [unclassified Neptuniibacter]MAY41699.1 hypothetical protein [Oceanospirillaceae bacterium]|tara:strand:- start:6155 stop:6748 length:594 start_codon:yes stop_codon:yes gene_type:complete
MAAELALVKGQGNTLIPMKASDIEWIQKLKPGRMVEATISQPRNYIFHKRFFALLNFAFDYWEPSAITIVEDKNFKSVRKFARFIADQSPNLRPNLQAWLNDFSKTHNSYEITPEKNFNQFRKDVTIIAGHYVSYYRIDGSVQVEAKSISFSKMDDQEFQELYKSVFNVLWKMVLSKTDMSYDEVEQILNQMLEFES